MKVKMAVSGGGPVPSTWVCVSEPCLPRSTHECTREAAPEPTRRVVEQREEEAQEAQQQGQGWGQPPPVQPQYAQPPMPRLCACTRLVIWLDNPMTSYGGVMTCGSISHDILGVSVDPTH